MLGARVDISEAHHQSVRTSGMLRSKQGISLPLCIACAGVTHPEDHAYAAFLHRRVFYLGRHASRPYGAVGIVEVACLKGARCRGRSVGHGGVHRQFIVFASLPVLCCRACCAAVFHDNATSLVASAQGIVSRRFHDGAKLSIRFLPCLYVV